MPVEALAAPANDLLNSINCPRAIVGASEGASYEDKALVIMLRSDVELPLGLSIIEIKAST